MRGHGANRRSIRIIAVLMALALPLGSVGAEEVVWERVKVDPPLATVIRTVDGDSISGRLTAYDARGFELRDPEDEAQQLAWTQVSAQRAYEMLGRLLDARDARAWLDVGAMMLARDDGDRYAEQAFTRAVHLDASLSDRVERLRRGETAEPAPASKESEAHAAGGDGAPHAGAPEVVGPIEAANWGPLTDEQHAEAVLQLKAFAAQGTQVADVNLRLFETKYFLFYTDLDQGEARRWAGLLDQMYNRLCDLFGISRGVNIWRGKCLIFVFAQERDYQRFELLAHGVSALGTAGRCWSFGDGSVHVVFYRQPDESLFAHVLVHEAVHGFLHRYRSPHRITSAWNEGLAEVIASELVPRSNVVSRHQARSITELKRRGGLGTFFHADQIEPWHYGIASGLTAMMIRENKRGYVAFINGIKDGLPWRESLEKNYGVSLERLVAYYGRTIDVRALEP